MAIYHLNARGCSPSTGAGAVRKAAYQSGQALVEERSGELCDYARKERVTAEGLALPAAVPAVDRGALWNEAERVWANAGGGKELVAKRYEFALPIELDERGRRECVRDFCALFPTRACDWAIHDDGRGGNPHAHVLVSALDLGAEGFIPRTRSDKGQSWYLCENDGGERIVVPATDWAAAKAAGWQKLYNFEDGKRRTMRKAKAEGLGTKDRVSKSPVKMHRRDGQSAREVEKEQLDEVRAAWAKIANRHLAAAAAAAGVVPQVIDHRSNKERGLAEEPTIHEGGVGLIGHADRVKQNDEIRARNERLRVLRAELRQEGAELERLRDEVAELERQRGRIERSKRGRAQGRHKGALAKRRRVAMATAAAAAETQRRMAMAAANQVDTRVEMIAQLDEQIADLDQEMHRLQRGGTAMMMSSNLIKATELAAERKKLADERDRLAGGMAQAESPELEPEDGRRRGPRR